MSELMMKMALDISVACLLAVTIYYCSKLNKRIRVLQDSKSELAQLIKQFDESTRQATASIVEIQRASKKINENIQAKLDKANYLADDLAFMIERGNKTADKMQGRISSSREMPADDDAAQKVQRAVRSARRNSPDTASEGKQDERQRTRADMAQAASQRTAAEDKKSGIEAMMERITELKSGQSQTKAKRPMARMRTRSEQDLLQAMKDKG